MGSGRVLDVVRQQGPQAPGRSCEGISWRTHGEQREEAAGIPALGRWGWMDATCMLEPEAEKSASWPAIIHFVGCTQ